MMKPWTPVSRGRKVDPAGLTVYPVERLGNQLFTYAAVFAQAKRLGVPCYVNKAFYDHVRPRRTYSFDYELDVFDSGLIVPDDAAYHLPVFMGFPTVPAASTWHNTVAPRLPRMSPRVFMERSFTYDARLRAVSPGTTVLGMFQSWRYFDDVGDEIRDRMSRLTKPSDWYQEMCAKVRPGSGSIALHVRRGDYTLPSQQKIQGLATRAYYERALAHLRHLGLTGELFVATDSLDTVRSEFDGMGDFTPIDPPPGANPFEVVLVLSRVDGLVIANSSFSWWAGYIGERPDRVVIAPRPWFTDPRMDSRDLLPPHWLSLDRGSSQVGED